jgi:hypothetical protein
VIVHGRSDFNGCGERKCLCWIKVVLVFYYGKMNNKCELEWFDGGVD